MKKNLALLLALIMLLAMTACGKNEEGTPTDESTGATTNTTESTNDTTDDTQNGTQGTTESTTGGDTTETTAPPTTTPPTTTPPTTTSPTTPPATTPSTTTPTQPTVTEPSPSLPSEIAIEAFSVSTTTYNMTIGDKAHIAYTITPSNATETISWKTDNSSIVTVDNGMITAVGIGNTVISASSSNAGFSVSVTVSGKSIKIDSFSISQSQYRLSIGESTIVSTTITPSNATEKLNWTSSDTSVATVENGKITAKGKGTAFIIASSDNCGSIVCTVDVYSPVTNITFDKDSYTVGRSKSITIGVTLTPADASLYRLTWTSENPSIARVTNGTVVGVSNGTTTITVTSEDGGFSKSCTVAVVDAPLTARYNLRHSTSINGWQEEGLLAEVVVDGGSGNYSNYSFNITIYHNGNVVKSANNISGNSYNSGWIAVLNVTFTEIKQYYHGDVGWDGWSGNYTAVFEVIDDSDNSHSGTATYSW